MKQLTVVTRNDNDNTIVAMHNHVKAVEDAMTLNTKDIDHINFGLEKLLHSLYAKISTKHMNIERVDQRAKNARNE